MKFSGRNFQPWSDFSLNISGLTMVIGPSNHGKSSLYRALRGVLRNELDVAYIRNPKEEPLELTFQHNDYTIVASRSKKGSVRYVVNHPSFGKPKEYSKLDGDVPGEIKEFKFGEIKVGDFTFDPIFASQNRPQFLIDNDSFKPSEINALFGAFGGTEKLEAGKKQANLLKTQKDSEARVLAGQIRNSEERKERLADMSTKAQAIEDALYTGESAIRQLELETHELTETANCLRCLQPLQRIASALEVPDISGIERAQQLITYAEQAAQSGIFAKWINKPLYALETIAESWNAALALWRQSKALNETAGLLSAQTNTQELEAFQTGISITELNRLQDSISLLERTAALRRDLKETARELAEIDDQLSTEQLVLAETQKALHDAELVAERQRAEELTSKGLCPRCGKSLEHICQK